MKIFAATVLVLLITCTPALGSGDVRAEEERTTPENITSILPKTEASESAERNEHPPIASALDLSLFGIISLGVLGLFWIRRHTSEL